ncbi:phosphonate metabolism transcriptional regulator PhnF [Cognatishimia activa]|uniref:Putative transcriptional regulator PhnF n=1 Tax=Cognatishimia activa TaxID=1715691 RepID=A0A0P1ITE4_9RHOB|nr:phosphonate metabolism transcriptional regulator PhnF [Cognatishimia activa]CUI75628.1 putative transcriptional regulator PhnF [Cognatishimia activa]CUK26715.1 putative transcriptional regulator PhnF [Cognatishimia activa]
MTQSNRSSNGRTPIWRAIANALRMDIAENRYKPGDKLPTEAVLSERFGVNRHTVRHALSALVEEGLVHTRRGAGAFVKSVPAEYPLGKRMRFHQNLRQAGRLPSKRTLSLESRPATEEEADRLKIPTGDTICVRHGVSLTDGHPIALSISHFPEARLPGIAQALAEETSITKALAKAGVTDFTRSSTRIRAVLADATQALRLQVREGAPLLYSTGLDVDGDGMPVEYGMTWFCGERMTLTFEED